MKRIIAAGMGLGLVVGAGCAPRTKLVAGAAAVVTSAMIIASIHDDECDQTKSLCEGELVEALADAMVATVAAGIGITGLGLMTVGGLQLYAEHGEEQQAERRQAEAAQLGPIHNPTLEPQARDLVLQIQLAARANRCDEAERQRAQLHRLNPAASRALTASDEFVAHCASAAVTSNFSMPR